MNRFLLMGCLQDMSSLAPRSTCKNSIQCTEPRVCKLWWTFFVVPVGGKKSIAICDRASRLRTSMMPKMQAASVRGLRCWVCVEHRD